MSTKPRPSTENLKQKSLTSFFSKPSASASGSKIPKKAPVPQTPIAKAQPEVKTKERDQASEAGFSPQDISNTNASSSSQEPKTPDSRFLETHAPNSVASSRFATSPPTSDAIDVDMASSFDEEGSKFLASSVSNCQQLNMKLC